MDSPLAAVFLAVIGLTALLQAGFVCAIALGVRAGNRKLAEVEAAFETSVAPRIRSAGQLTRKAAALAEKSLAQAGRVDTMVGDATRNAERYLDEASLKLEGAVERAAMRVDSEIAIRTARARENRILGKLSSASAFIAGLQRALEVWQASAASEGDGGGANADEGDFDEGIVDDDDPSDPSPA